MLHNLLAGLAPVLPAAAEAWGLDASSRSDAWPASGDVAPADRQHQHRTKGHHPGQCSCLCPFAFASSATVAAYCMPKR